MKVLITGGAGFIGSFLTESLVSDGHDVIILDNFITGNLKNLNLVKSNVNIVEGDIRDEKLVDDLVSNTDVVFHMAAALGVNNILMSALNSISVNISGSNVILKTSAKYDKRIIIASTSEIYGKNPKQPLTENDDRVIGSPQKIRWTYSDSKAIEEATAAFLHETQNLRVTTIRLFNTVGPRQKGKYGMVVPRFVYNALMHETLSVYGNGEQTRVFCHVLDTVDALLKISKTDKSIGEVYNLGGTREISILKLAQKVIQLTNSTSRIEFIPYNEAYTFGFEDVQRRVPDISKLKSIIDWEPKRDLDEIILDTKNFYMGNIL